MSRKYLRIALNWLKHKQVIPNGLKEESKAKTFARQRKRATCAFDNKELCSIFKFPNWILYTKNYQAFQEKTYSETILSLDRS